MSQPPLASSVPSIAHHATPLHLAAVRLLLPRSKPFPATVQNYNGTRVRGLFLELLLALGGVSQCGLPVSCEMLNDGILVQHFEKVRLEFHDDGFGYHWLTPLTDIP